MANTMFVDVARYRWFAIIAVVCGVLILSAILLGEFGPNTYDKPVYYAYDCPGDDHVCCDMLSNAVCPGTALRTGAVYVKSNLQYSRLNQFVSLVVYPYNLNNTEINGVPLKVNVTVTGSHSKNGAQSVIASEIRDESLNCDSGTGSECWPFMLVYINSIDYDYYTFLVSLPKEDNPGRSAIGDTGFEFVTYNASFMEEQLSLRIIFLLFSAALVVVFFLRMRVIPFREWTAYQKCTAVVLISQIALNNPFYPFEFFVPGPYFQIIDALMQVTHSSVIILYWLVIFDYSWKGRVALVFNKWDIFKPCVVGLYWILTATFYLWWSIQQSVEPVLPSENTTSGLVVLFFLCALVYGAIIVWILVLIFFTAPVVSKKTYLMARFLYTVTPAAIIIVSLMIGLFLDTFGPTRRTALSFCYFYTLYNIYGCVLLIGCWPTQGGFAAFWAPSTSTEDTEEEGAIFTEQLSKATEESALLREQENESIFGTSDSSKDNLYGNDNAL